MEAIGFLAEEAGARKPAVSRARSQWYVLSRPPTETR